MTTQVYLKDFSWDFLGRFTSEEVVPRVVGDSLVLVFIERGGLL